MFGRWQARFGEQHVDERLVVGKADSDKIVEDGGLPHDTRARLTSTNLCERWRQFGDRRPDRLRRFAPHPAADTLPPLCGLDGERRIVPTSPPRMSHARRAREIDAHDRAADPALEAAHGVLVRRC